MSSKAACERQAPPVNWGEEPLPETESGGGCSRTVAGPCSEPWGCRERRGRRDGRGRFPAAVLQRQRVRARGR
ncbi:unnamed protein product [Lepidochelys olivacea]